MRTYLISYIDPDRGECWDSEDANNQNTAYNRFMERRPKAQKVRIKGSGGVWVNHYLD